MWGNMYPKPEKPTKGNLIAAVILLVFGILCIWLCCMPGAWDSGSGIVVLFSGVVSFVISYVCFKDHTRLNNEYELSQNDPVAYQRLQREKAKKEHEAWEKEQERKKAEVDAKYNHYRYKCPMCGSNKIINIEYNRKDMGNFLYGVNSPLFGKTYQCDDCKYLW